MIAYIAALMHVHLPHFEEPLKPVIGFAGAILSGAAYYLGQHTTVLPDDARNWAELGGTVGLVAGLSYGCTTLWKALQDSNKVISDLNKEIRDNWRDMNDKLIAALEKLNPDN